MFVCEDMFFFKISHAALMLGAFSVTKPNTLSDPTSVITSLNLSAM